MKITQQGFGLVEVMVAVLLLAIAVLGFNALQMQSVKATDESLIRSDALSAMRGLSEDIRLNPKQKANYQAFLGQAGDATDAATYCSKVNTFANTVAKKCDTEDSCNLKQQAKFNSLQAMQTICDSSMMMNAMTCPGTDINGALKKTCIIASWGSTLPIMSSADNACADETGSYNRGSNCLVMETY